jgi:signal transduction histidine kinase
VRRTLSIGAEWTLRYTLALLVTISVFAGYTYSEIARSTERDARLVLQLQVEEVATAWRRSGGNLEVIGEVIDRGVTSADGTLKLGLQVFPGEDGPGIVAGSLAAHSIEAPPLLLEDGEPTWRQLDVGENYPYLVMTIPVRGGVVQGALYMRRFVRNARDVRDIYLYAIPVVGILTALIGYALARGSLRPLAEMNRTARRISATHLDEAIPTTGSGDELDELALTLNQMVGRIRRGVERARRFAGNAAHQLRTPLNSLRSRLEVTLEKERPVAEYQQILSETVQEMQSLSETVHGMMRLAQSEAGLAPEQRTQVPLADLLDEVVEFFIPLAGEKGLIVDANVADAPAVPGDASWLNQLFANLLHNAIKYTPDRGKIGVSMTETADQIAIHVEDSGPGIAAEEQARIFEPFHRAATAPNAPGAGLGLPIAREIARAHGGDIQVDSTPGKGARFSVWLPLETPEV